jgi:hypothetical protein
MDGKGSVREGQEHVWTVAQSKPATPAYSAPSPTLPANEPQYIGYTPNALSRS